MLVPLKALHIYYILVSEEEGNLRGIMERYLKINIDTA
jgi:hypothetical protein